MKIDFSTWTASDFAAWWGAIIATLVVTWNMIVAVRSGARIHVRANPDMQVYPRQPNSEDNTYISVTAVNRGNSSTTITHFCGYYCKGFWDLLRRKKQKFIVKTGPALGKPLPCVLNPGEEWSSMAEQKSLQEQSAGGFLYIGILHNQRKRLVYKRVKFRS
jgi:hypothetical protein